MGFERSMLLSIFVVSLVSQSLLLPLIAASSSNSLETQKKYYSPPRDPHSSPPSHGHSPPSHGGSGSCTPTTPSHHGGHSGYYHSPPSTPPPSTITPVTPPVPVDPGSGYGPFPCNYWGSHPGLIWGVLGYWGTVGGVFGVPTLPGVSSNFTIHHALTNTRQDGYSSLYREAAASFLNSVSAPTHFPFTTNQVRASFVSALASDKAAASQARLFRLANQGRFNLH